MRKDIIGVCVDASHEDSMRVYNKGVSVVQLNTGNSWSLAATLPTRLHQAFTLFKTVVCHMPVSFGILQREEKNERICANLLYNTSKTIDLCIRSIDEPKGEVRKVPIVTHVGYAEGESETTRDRLIDIINKFLERTKGQNTILCLENSPGSKSGIKVGTVSWLYEIVKSINNDRVKLCIDTQHWYVSNEQKELLDLEFWKELRPYIGIVHFNSIPVYCGKGSHLDRHSDTYLSESVQEWKDNWRSVFEFCQENELITIIEQSPSYRGVQQMEIILNG